MTFANFIWDAFLQCTQNDLTYKGLLGEPNYESKEISKVTKSVSPVRHYEEQVKISDVSLVVIKICYHGIT